MSSTRNIKLYVRQDVGKGNPIVLLHGIFGDGTQWDKITELLKSDYRVIVVDVLGHGKSPRPTSATYTPDEHADALRNALESIHATKNLTVVGYSMGGSVAVSYAAKYPSGIKQLYLISTPFYLKPDQMIAAKYALSVVVTKFSQTMYKYVEHFLGDGKILQKVVSYGDTSELFHKMIGAHDNKLDSKIIKLNIKHMIAEFDFAGRLEKIKVPTTYYAGKKDPFVVQGQVYALKKFSTYIDIRRLDIIKVDHMLVQNLPKEIVQLITKNKDETLHIASDTGKGKTIVLLHGIESSSDYWKNLVPALSEQNRILSIDLLGFGKSPKPKNVAYSLDDQVTWLHKTLQSIDVQRCTIAGHSLGSLVALAYAATYPKHVSSLVLFSPVLLPENRQAKKLSVKALQTINYVPDTSYLYSQAAESLGDDKLRNYLPSARSIENAIKSQHSVKLARSASSVPAHLHYGTADPLIDASFISHIASKFTTHTINAYPNKNHNFPIFEPGLALAAIDGNKTHKNKPRKTSVLPPSFLSQLTKLAVPTLVAKSLFFIAIGLLLFSDYAPTTLTVGLSVYVIYQGYKTIRGAFSLKNEGLSYIGYILLGIFTAFLGYALYKHPSESIKIAAYIVVGLILVAGIMRILVGLKWTTSKALKRTLLLTGSAMTLVGLAAFAGSVKSVYIIVYSIAILLIVRGIVFGWYAFGALIMAYIRGYNQK
jgi:pimeloyl-ACP methyl ester carboxylesterase/uncharacterized membrane protein HdeD (DUF308 family)